MIDWERTELRPYGTQNAMHVWVKCDKCGKERWAHVNDARNFRLPGHLCQKCAMREFGQSRWYLDPCAFGKTCPYCKKYKLRSEFGRSKYKRDGLRTYCKECGRKAARRYREQYPDKSRQSKRLAQSKRRAQKRNSWGDFDGDDWAFILDKYGHKCLACDEIEDLQPDHIIPLSLGGIHHKSNIQPLCGLCNRKKQAQIVDYRPDAYWADWT